MSAVTEVGHDSTAAVDATAALRFKLFGRTIPMRSSSPAGMKAKHKTEDVALDFADLDGDSDDYGEDGGIGPDELGSSSGSNNGCDEEKPVDGMDGGLVENLFVGAPPGPLIGDVPGKLQAVEVKRVSQAVEVKRERNEEGRESDDGIGDESTEDQAPKKPEKPISCPRCQSLDTKFCYFNNYNVNQPRHFCKNCQRYWTAGGTLRNVPVGAGRRKNKHSSSGHHRSMLPDGLVVRADALDCAQQLLSPVPVGLSKNMKSGPATVTSSESGHLLPLEVSSLSALDSASSSAVLSFGLDSPLFGGAGTVSSNPRKAEVLQGYKPEAFDGFTPTMDADLPKVVGSGFTHPDEKHTKRSSCSGLEANNYPLGWQSVCAGEPISIPLQGPAANSADVTRASTDLKPHPAASNTMLNSTDSVLKWAAAGAPFSYLGCPWPYPGSGSWPNTPLTAQMQSALQGAGNVPLQGISPGFQPPWAGALGSLWAAGIPWPFMQTPMCMPPACWSGNWTMPWGPAAAAAAAAAAATVSPMVSSPFVGKRPRVDGELDSDKGGSLLVPKTLRIGDPGDAARSSIWTTLGIENWSDSRASGGMFGALHTKADSKEVDGSCLQSRQSNPAALTRSMAFQENNMVSQNVDALRN